MNIDPLDARRPGETYAAIKRHFLEWWDNWSGNAAERAARAEQAFWNARIRDAQEASRQYYQAQPNPGLDIKARERRNLEVLCIMNRLPRRGVSDEDLAQQGILVAPAGYQTLGDTARLVVLPKGWQYTPVDEMDTSNAHIVDDTGTEIVHVTYRDSGTGRPIAFTYLSVAPESTE